MDSGGRSGRSPTANKPQAPAPALCHCKTGESARVYAAFLQNAPVVRHTRGFTPGWYAVPRWGTPNASPLFERTCERRTVPAEAPPQTSPRRQPRHSATAKQVRAPKCMRRSFRTLRLCVIPGVSPRAGMWCPVRALRMPHLPRAFLPRPNHHAAAGSGRSEHRNVDTLIPLAR